MTRTRGTAGFTLMELILTVAMMGIFAAVVVFGTGDFGTPSGCKADAKMLRNAEASFYVANGRYAPQEELVDAGMMRAVTPLHDVKIEGLSYTMVELGKCIGTNTTDSDVIASETVTTVDGFSVLVAGSNGTPVANTAVSYRKDGGSSWDDLGATDETGVVTGEVPAGRYDIRATLWGATNDLFGVDVTSGTLVVLPTVALTIQFQDSATNPLPDGAAAIRQTGTQDWFSIGVTPNTGSFVVEVLPSDYDVQLTAFWTTWDDTTNAPTDGVSNSKANLAINSATTVTFQTTKLTVKIFDSSGAPVGDAAISAKPTGAADGVSAVTGSDGWAVLQLLPGSYDISETFVSTGAVDGTVATLKAVPIGSLPVVAELVVP